MIGNQANVTDIAMQTGSIVAGMAKKRFVLLKIVRKYVLLLTQKLVSYTIRIQLV